MILWILAIFFYHFIRRGKINRLDILMISVYFLVAFFLASVSMSFFPLGGDELLYDECGRNLSSLILQGQFFNFPTSACSMIEVNSFLKVVGYLYILGSGAYSLVGFNIFILFVAVDLILQALSSNERNRSLFALVLFSPPILYLILRPAKEATIAFLVSFAIFAYFQRGSIPRACLLGLAFLLFYFFRWQYSVVLLIALGATEFCLFIRNSSSRKKWASVIFLAIFVGAGWFSFKSTILDHLYGKYFDPTVVSEMKNSTGRALIYKVMEDTARPLTPWNILVAHVFTPHPFRFVKEWTRDGKFKYHIFEEFIFVSFWFYLLLPLFVLYLKSKIKVGSRQEIFQIIFVSLLFSIACFSLFLRTSQLFRYKLPLNLFLFSVIAIYVHGKGLNSVLDELKLHRSWLGFYVFVIAVYSILYLA
jgi:hypothetical protein